MRSTIIFQMEEPEIELKEKLVQVDHFYVRNVKQTGNSLKFSIPQDLTRDLGLKKKSIAYYTLTNQGIHIYFDMYPVEIKPIFIKSRKISQEGLVTKYLTIPPMVKTAFNKEIVAISLIHNKGDPSYLWQMQPLSTDSLLESTSESI